MSGQPGQDNCLGLSFRFKQRENWAAGVSQHCVDGAVAGKVLEDISLGGAEHDERSVAIRCLGQDLNGGIPMNDTGLNRTRTAAPGLFGNESQFSKSQRVGPGGQPFSFHLVDGRQNMEQN